MQIMQYVAPYDFEGRGLDALGASPDAPAVPGYAIDADAAYPAAIAHIQAVLDGQGHPPTLSKYVDEARALLRENPELDPWALARQAYAAFNPNDPADAAALAVRRPTIELVRGWCIELLHLAQGYAPMNVKILGSKDWKTG
jgi:hypothetical protein